MTTPSPSPHQTLCTSSRVSRLRNTKRPRPPFDGCEHPTTMCFSSGLKMAFCSGYSEGSGEVEACSGLRKERVSHTEHRRQIRSGVTKSRGGWGNAKSTHVLLYHRLLEKVMSCHQSRKRQNLSPFPWYGRPPQFAMASQNWTWTATSSMYHRNMLNARRSEF